MITYNFNNKKALEVILWIAKKSSNVEIYKMLKAIFFADKYHLNKYFRTILGDTYCAMPYGPGASRTYDILKGDPLEIEELDEIPLPFEKRENNIIPKREPNLRKLSKSDIEALEYGWSEVKDKSFEELKNITHEMSLYKNAWENRTNNAPIIDYRDFLDEKNKEQAEEIFECADSLVL
jgi:uncharacterized phage-associated protein